MAENNILRLWVTKLTLREQGSLICAARNCDLTPKLPLDAPERVLTAALRYAFMLPFDEREVDSEKGCFMISQNNPDFIRLVQKFKVSWLAHYPLHFVQKQWLACEVLAYRMPNEIASGDWLILYHKICQGLHVNPETKEQYLTRLTEDRIASNSVVS